MAYSDQGEFDRSIALLARLLEQEPQYTNGRVALGVALVRKGQIADGVEVTADIHNPDFAAIRSVGDRLTLWFAASRAVTLPGEAGGA
jgi:lipopolysaccharide biosynthesis regulator YciM